jgi:hypothetical protein
MNGTGGLPLIEITNSIYNVKKFWCRGRDLNPHDLTVNGFSYHYGFRRPTRLRIADWGMRIEKMGSRKQEQEAEKTNSVLSVPAACFCFLPTLSSIRNSVIRPSAMATVCGLGDAFSVHQD